MQYTRRAIILRYRPCRQLPHCSHQLLFSLASQHVRSVVSEAKECLKSIQLTDPFPRPLQSSKVSQAPQTGYLIFLIDTVIDLGDLRYISSELRSEAQSRMTTWSRGLC